ncbi:purine nucleotide binding protein [Coprinopsis sp. MPI-PUGE-AT-0042]|nr:purine nucleotide binding protein [Coprinopsis sp. MPI-PUGE-AT-0042]
MPPSTSKNAKPAGKDLRLFFKSTGSGTIKPPPPPTLKNSSQTTALQKTGSLKANPIAISDDDDEPKKAAPKQEAVKKESPKKALKAKVLVEDSDEEQLEKKASALTLKRKNTTAIVSSDEEDEATPPPKKKAAVASTKSSKPVAKPAAKASSSKPVKKPAPKKKRKDEDYAMESDDEDEKEFVVDDDDDDNEQEFVVDDDEDEPKKGKKAAKKAAPKKAPAKSTAKKEANEDEEKPAAKKPNWAAAKAAKLARQTQGPAAPGSKAIPDGAPDALAGLAFVFTGELTAFSRDEAVELAKRFGGRVVGQPSSKTDYVVLGEDAGPKKLEAIKKHKLVTLDEDGFLNLIATRKGLGNGKIDDKTKKKMEKEEAEIKKAAKEMESREKKDGNTATQLWTSRYAPQNIKEVCGNKGQVDKLQQWLNDWSTSLKSGFKKPGKNGMNTFRAVLITGSPGIGKTTSAHLCAKLAGFTPIELNASDARSKKLVENGMNVNNTSLDGFIKGAQKNSVGVDITDRTCIIMDEVDGMSAGDRGGVGALNVLIRKSKVPIICIANDRTAQKLKPLQSTTFSLPFHKPQVTQIRSRILSIAFKEKLKIPPNVIDQLITGAQSDIRQVLNMLSTWRLSSTSMDFDEGKEMVRMNEKHQILSPFDITSKVLGPYLFSATSRETLGDKMEYYFQDHSFVPLFIQENYLKSQPARLKNYEGPERVMKELRLMDQAAASISDGDLVDALIHGPEQHWGLMPLHAVCSTVRPASFFYGTGAHYGGSNPISFPQWLGQNSKQQKLSRALGDVQIRMRLKVSGDKSEIRQSYIPALFPHVVKPLMDDGSSAVDEVIERMDEYYLSREDWDTIVELGLDTHKDDLVLKNIATATKTAFTRKYNASEHPIPFHKATDLGKVPKKLAGGPAPDLEDVFEVDDEGPDASDDESKSKDDSDDVTKDSLIKQPKKKAAAPTAKPKVTKAKKS